MGLVRLDARKARTRVMEILSENAVSQGMVLASLIGGIALASIAQLVSAFPGRGESPGGDKNKDIVTAAITWLAVAATVMMINVWSGIIFFMDDGGDRRSIAVLFYGGLLIGVLFFALGMAETVAIRASRLRRPILVMFGGLLVAEAVLALIFLV
jgi:magnesium-transporting ATPase (P-type)